MISRLEFTQMLIFQNLSFSDSEERNKNTEKIVSQNPLAISSKISSPTYSGNIQKMDYKNFGKYFAANVNNFT